MMSKIKKYVNETRNTDSQFMMYLKIGFVLLALCLFVILPASAADTSVAWTKDIGDVTTVDMSEDGFVIYAAVGSQVFIYDAAGIQQNVFTVGGNVVKLVCTADGTRATLYTDGNDVYYIDNNALTWSQSFTAITDIDISNAGNVLIVEGTQFHKYLSDGSLEYDSEWGTYNLGVIDPDDEFTIVQSGTSDLQKYLLTTTDQYWRTVGNNTSFDTRFQDYQNLLILYTNETSAIILSNTTLGEELWNQIYGDLSESTLPKGRSNIAVSNDNLSQTDSSSYFDSTGTTWTQATASAQWAARFGACSWVYDGKMFIGGGGAGSGFLSDVWYSTDGTTWTQATASAQWAGRYMACSWVYDGKMFIGGGTSGSGVMSDVWYSTDGTTWTQATASAQWAARSGACSWVYDGKMFIGGGNTGSAVNDIWYSSDGTTWTRATASAQWAARYAACSWVYDDKMFIGGGFTGSGWYNDVWYSSDGTTWTRATASAQWAARGFACSWVYGGKMFIGGGNIGSAVKDIWYSSDGTTWTQATASAQWAARFYATSWVYDGKMFIGGGNTRYADLKDVWYSTDPYFIVSSNNPTYIFYNNTGNNPQHTQTTYTGAVPFTGTTELRTKPTLSIYDLQTTKTLNGNIAAISLSARGDWVGTATSTRIYHDQITSSGFGTEYYAALGSTGAVYDIATANSASMSILGQGQITDIYSMSASRVGTYTAGGAVTHVDIADRNALWAASGGEDGKVYIFSKDASSNWYLEYSSDSENPITALRMSARGEYILAGRTNSLTLYQTNTPEVVQTDFWFTLYAYKDSDSYRNAAINVSVYSGNQWNSFTQGLTDSAGKYVVQLTAGQTYKFDVGNGQKVVVVMASPSVTSQTVNIYTTPISAAITYEATWDADINGIDFKYNDNSGQTNSVTVKVQRTDTWETVYEQTFSGTQSIDEQLPIVDDTTSYKVEFSANRVSGVARNSYILSSSRDIIPIPLDQNIKNVLFSCFLIVLAGLFSYMSAIRGALVVAMTATLFVYLGWLTIPWHWLIIAIVIAVVAGFTQRRG